IDARQNMRNGLVEQKPPSQHRRRRRVPVEPGGHCTVLREKNQRGTLPRPTRFVRVTVAVEPTAPPVGTAVRIALWNEPQPGGDNRSVFARELPHCQIGLEEGITEKCGAEEVGRALASVERGPVAGLLEPVV